jgi:16S rRNA (adenine1518-N6/adenine1519-N6)-dimethyltransferase
MPRKYTIQKLLKEHKLAPKKWLGQNLLVDPHYLQAIVDAADVQPGEPIVEVGAGFGQLTEALRDRGARVWALEIDWGFVRLLTKRFAQVSEIVVIPSDALEYDFRGLAESVGRLRVVANLPYSVSSRLVFRFVENRDIFRSLHILLQREVAERLVAPPGTKEYGILSVLLGVTAEVQLLFQVPPAAFYPVPAVTSTLVRVMFPDVPPVDVANMGLLILLVKAAFGRRRKTLRNTLEAVRFPGVTSELVRAAATDAEIELGRRGETLSPREFARLADAVDVRLTH